MKQPGIASFFGKANGKGAGAKVEAKGDPVLEKEKEKENDPAGKVTAPDKCVAGVREPCEKKREIAEKKGTGRLKRLKKAADEGASEEATAPMPEDLEDMVEEPTTDEAKAGTTSAPCAAGKSAGTAPASPGGVKASKSEALSKTVHPFFAPRKQTTPKKTKSDPQADGCNDAKGASANDEASGRIAESDTKESKEAVGEPAKVAAEETTEKASNQQEAKPAAVHPLFLGAKAKEAEKSTSALASATAAFDALIKACSSKTSGIKASTKDGVGAAALAAAELHKKYKKSVYLSWEAGVPTPYSFMAEAFEVIANTTKRQEKACVLIDAFRTILASRPEDLIAAVRLTANELSPPHVGLELGLGEATLKDVLADLSSKSKGAIDKLFQEVGDLGSLAVEVRSKVRTLTVPTRLTLPTVLKSLQDVARVEGQKAMNRKKASIKKLLMASKGNEAGYVMRACEFKRGLRIGVNDSTLLTALAHAVHLHKLGSSEPDLADRLEETAQAVKQAFCECPSYEVLINALLDHDIANLAEHCHFMPGVPVKPMLAKPTLGVSEVLDKFQGLEFTCEYKYDGERAQIHILEDGTVQVYSRNSESSLGKYPDAAEIVKKHLKPGINSVVIDSEVVAFDRETGKIKPFQELSRRPKKVTNRADIKTELCVFPFDCLYLDGDILLRKPLSKRREALQAALSETPGECQLAKGKISNDLAVMQAFLDEAVSDCTEGLMVKSMDATYEPSKRSTNWLKLKKDYMEGAADSFDVVPIGAWYGKGKRTGVYGSFLLAIYNPQTEEFQTISKIGTGFSEEALEEQSKKLRELEIPKPRNYYKYGDSAAMRPEVWFDAKVVWEVKAADLSISPIHQAALGILEPGKGISIRFPRLVKERDDKGPEDATTAEQVAYMYRNQAVAKANAGGQEAAAEDDE